MFIELITLTAAMLATGIETAFVPSDGGGGEYLVRVEPDLVSSRSPYTFTSDIPVDERDVRRVCIYVADRWPATVERTVIEAASRPKVTPTGPTAEPTIDEGDSATIIPDQENKPWSLLVGSLIALFLSLGGNAYLGILLGGMRARYLSLVRERVQDFSGAG
ncbi:uncharacterized protein METZ01_LOCUS457806 [marine metagenome]|uniref:Uncharacterized protein n=1 Tax=marine metagenome TaxID=408172 RepID=A0A383AB69_9ZZZZ